jgi:hypothetical protein
VVGERVVESIGRKAGIAQRAADHVVVIEIFCPVVPGRCEGRVQVSESVVAIAIAHEHAGAKCGHTAARFVVEAGHVPVVILDRK